MADEAAPSQPTGRDRGYKLLAVLAALMLVGSVAATIVTLYADGLASPTIRLGLSVLFWYWIGIDARRRTTWSRQIRD